MNKTTGFARTVCEEIPRDMEAVFFQIWRVRLEGDKCQWGKCQRKYTLVSHSNYHVTFLFFSTMSERIRKMVESPRCVLVLLTEARFFSLFFIFIFLIFFLFSVQRTSATITKSVLTDPALILANIWPSWACTYCLLVWNCSCEYCWAFHYSFHYNVHFSHHWAVLITLRNHRTRAEYTFVQGLTKWGISALAR